MRRQYALRIIVKIFFFGHFARRGCKLWKNHALPGKMEGDGFYLSCSPKEMDKINQFRLERYNRVARNRQFPDERLLVRRGAGIHVAHQ